MILAWMISPCQYERVKKNMENKRKPGGECFQTHRHFRVSPPFRRRKGPQRIRWLDSITDSMDWVWASSRSWWRTGKPGVLQSMGSQRAGHDWATEHHHPLLWKFTDLDLYKQGHWEELSGLQVVVLRWTSRWGWRTRNRPNFVASSWLRSGWTNQSESEVQEYRTASFWCINVWIHMSSKRAESMSICVAFVMGPGPQAYLLVNLPPSPPSYCCVSQAQF